MLGVVKHEAVKITMLANLRSINLAVYGYQPQTSEK